MSRRQAKAITATVLRRMLAYTQHSTTPARDHVIILLSLRAGLRACEIAQLDWSMVLDARGRVADSIAVHDAITKKRSGRRIPMHGDLRKALTALQQQSCTVGPVVCSV